MVTALGSFQHSRRWRPKTQKIIMDEKFTWSPTWHTINNVSWCVGICIILTKVKGPHHHMVTTLARVWSGPRTCFAMANVTISRSTPFWQVHLHFMQRATPSPPLFNVMDNIQNYLTNDGLRKFTSFTQNWRLNHSISKIYVENLKLLTICSQD